MVNHTFLVNLRLNAFVEEHTSLKLNRHKTNLSHYITKSSQFNYLKFYIKVQCGDLHTLHKF